MGVWHDERNTVSWGPLSPKHRAELGPTQRALARKLAERKPQFRRIEAETQRVDLVELSDIAAALRLELQDLIRRFEQRAKQPLARSGNTDYP